MAGILPYRIAAAAVTGMRFTNQAAFFQDFQGTVDGYQSDTRMVISDAFINGGGGLVFMGIHNFADNDAALGGNFIAAAA